VHTLGVVVLVPEERQQIIGFPKCIASVVVLLPPWVITRSTWGISVVCGRVAAPVMLSASRSSSARGPC
jgi:hypothetical protein